MSVQTRAREAAMLERLGPLHKARADLDDECVDMRLAVFSRLINGEALSTLLAEPISSPGITAAETLLSNELTGGIRRWPDWVRLKLAVLTMRQRVFAPAVLSSHGSRSQRRQMHGEAYIIEGELLEETVALKALNKGDKDYQSDISGSITELLALSLLNRASPATAGARISRASSDQFWKVDSRYDIFRAGRLKSVSLQLKTWGETEVLPGKILQFGLCNVLGSRCEATTTADMVIRDIHHDLNEAERSELADRAIAVQAIVHQSSLLTSFFEETK